MIPFNFVYYRPDTLIEAADIFSTLQSQGGKTVYYAGGSEIISMCRIGSIQPEAVIDIKNIPDCKLLSVDEERLHIGSVCTLSQISESKLFPLMRLACGRIAVPLYIGKPVCHCSFPTPKSRFSARTESEPSHLKACFMTGRG
jgi:CO/xanthine dehydrogenase FAD-binding subunit